MVLPLHQGPSGAAAAVGAEARGRRRVPGVEVAAPTQLLPGRKDSRRYSQRHQLSGREAPPACHTCHGTLSHGHQPGLSSAGRALPMCQSWWCLLPSTGSPAPGTPSPWRDSHSLPSAAPTEPPSQTRVQVWPCRYQQLVFPAARPLSTLQVQLPKFCKVVAR